VRPCGRCGSGISATDSRVLRVLPARWFRIGTRREAEAGIVLTIGDGASDVPVRRVDRAQHPLSAVPITRLKAPSPAARAANSDDQASHDHRLGPVPHECEPSDACAGPKPPERSASRTRLPATSASIMATMALQTKHVLILHRLICDRVLQWA
jgi:hypothetical protein